MSLFYWEPELIIHEHWIQRKKCIHWLVNNFIWHSVLVITWLVKSRDNVWLTIMWYLLLWANEHVLVLHVVGNYEYKLCPFHIAEKPFSANQKYSYSYRENFSSNHFMHRFQKIFFSSLNKKYEEIDGCLGQFIYCLCVKIKRTLVWKRKYIFRMKISLQKTFVLKEVTQNVLSLLLYCVC